MAEYASNPLLELLKEKGLVDDLQDEEISVRGARGAPSR